MNTLGLAYRYLKFYWLKNAIIILALALVFYLPFGLNFLIKQAENELMKRANSTDLILGKEANYMDLTLTTLYFTNNQEQEYLKIGNRLAIDSLLLGNTIPILCGLQARKIAVVGTDIDYFEYRNLSVNRGRLFQKLGECVLGAKTAESLSLNVNDSIITSSENFLDMAGTYPLKMTISGILSACHCPDDNVIFTDIKSSWIAMGIGHGHDDLSSTDDASMTFSKSNSLVKYTAKIRMYQEITGGNIESFHFHGDEFNFPVTSFLFIPNDEKSLTIFRGKLESRELGLFGFVPKKVISSMLQDIFKFESIFYAIFILTLVSTLLIFSLIVFLNIRLRENLIETMYIMGASRIMVVNILILEVLLLLIISAALVLILYMATPLFTNQFVQLILT